MFVHPDKIYQTAKRILDRVNELGIDLIKPYVSDLLVDVGIFEKYSFLLLDIRFDYGRRHVILAVVVNDVEYRVWEQNGNMFKESWLYHESLELYDTLSTILGSIESNYEKIMRAIEKRKIDELHKKIDLINKKLNKLLNK